MLEFNVLDIVGRRKVSYLPAHFTKISVGKYLINTTIEDWIQNKLKGRYWMSDYPTVDSSGKLQTTLFVGFEDQKELTYFMLACPFIRR
jgi:hypothetical protein